LSLSARKLLHTHSLILPVFYLIGRERERERERKITKLFVVPIFEKFLRGRRERERERKRGA
jgi:hypothetical protein